MSKNKKILIIIPILLLVIIIMSMNISSLKKLFADINSLSTDTTTFKDWSEAPQTLDSKYSNSTIFLTKDSSFEVYRNKDGEVKKYTCDYSKFIDGDTYSIEEEYMKNSEYKFKIQWKKVSVNDNGNDYTFCFPTPEIDLLDGVTKQYLDTEVKLSDGFSILAKNSSIDSSGNYVDAVLTAKNIDFWPNTELKKCVYKSYINVNLLNGITTGDYAGLENINRSQVTEKLGIPFEFFLTHYIGQVDASLSFYKANTYGTSNQEYADIKKIIGLYSDIDIYTNYNDDDDKKSVFENRIFKGNEGVAFTNPENNKTIYYDVDGKYGKKVQITNSDGSKTVRDFREKLSSITSLDENNKQYSGVYVSSDPDNINVADIHEKTSLFITEDLENVDEFNFRYASGKGAGIRFSFVSPIKYDIAGPVKTSSVTKTTDNKNYIYHIVQKIPNNYYGYALKFANYSGTLYNSISISDIFDEKLTNIDKNKITIVNENDLDVTKYFDISLSEENGKTKLVATISSSNSDNFISQVDFYNHTYKVNVPVTTKDKINKNKISNKASTTVDNDTSNILESNNVDVDVYYTVTINHIDEYDNTILKTTTDEVIYGNTFSSNKEDFENYENDYYESDADDGQNSGVVNKNITVNYYYKKKATVTVNYYKEGTTEKLADSDILNKYYGDKYDVTSYKDNKNISTDYKYVSYTSTPENTISGTVSQDTIIVNYYYVLKTATINIKYLDELTNKSILNEENIQTKYGVEYSSLNLDSYKKEITGYDYSKTETTPKDISGKVNQDTTTIIHYYKKKSNITIKYYDIETKKEIAKENVDSKVHYGDIYNVESKKIETEKEEIFKNYNFEKYESNSKQSDDLKQIKIDNENVTVNLYYNLKTSTLTIKYLEETTNKELAETYTKSMKYTEVYNATEIRDKAGVPKNYNLVRHESSTGVLSGTISEPSVLIIFYYEKKDPKLETSVSKTGTKEITRKDEEVEYKLNYKAVIKDYIGDAKVTYIDKLPYEIDEEKSDISGGKYNKETKTIIWEETYEKINMKKEITFTKEIKVVYIGIEDTDRIMTNEIETTIKLDNKENTVTSDYDTNIKIPGEIVIHYYDKETKEKLVKDIETTDLIGNQYVSEEKEFEGYKLVSKPESNVHIYKEKKQEFSYEYEKIKFKITTKVEGEGGTIEGDEIVKYGEDSSKDKIKIKAKDGYEINKITINGESYEITDRNEIIMPYFKEVKEDKEVIVSFVKKIENPKTIDNIMSYIGYALLSIIGLIISGIVLIKNKTQEKI